MSELVQVDEIPTVPIRAADIGAAATLLKDKWEALLGLGDDHFSTWSGLEPVYSTQQTPLLVARAWDAAGTLTKGAWAGRDVFNALDGLAQDFELAEAEAARLTGDIEYLRSRVLTYRYQHEPEYGGDPYWGWGQYSENTELRARALRLHDDIASAISRCTSALQDVAAAPRVCRVFGSTTAPLYERANMTLAQAQFEKTISFGILTALADAGDPEEVRCLLDDHPEWLEYFWQHPPHHTSVEAWWAGLTPAVAEQLKDGGSLIVGNLDGVPFRDRIEANRNTLIREIERLEALPGGERVAERLAVYNGYLNDTTEYRDADGRLVSVHGSQLLVFDPAHEAIAAYHGALDPETGGIPDWVDHVAVSVPGTGASVLGFANDRGTELYDASNRYSVDSTVLVQWCGGEMPGSIPEAMQDDYSRDLAPRLAAFVEAMPVPNASDTTVLGHSYGGATVGLASQHGLHADRVVFVSAAGMGNGVHGTGDYPYRPTTDYYSMMARNDLVVGAIQLQGNDPFAIHGQTPTNAPGVTRLETGQIDSSDPSSPDLEDYRAPGNSDPSGIQAHSTVYTPGSTAFDNMVGVITGGDVQAYMPNQFYPNRYGGFQVDGNDRDDLAPRMLEVE